MPQHHSTLTEFALRSARLPARGTVTLWDGAVRRFGARITSKGVKSFIVLFGNTGRRQVIGRYPDITLAQARSKASKLLAERTLGRHQTASISWDRAVEKFLEACKTKNRPRTWAEYERNLARYFGFGSTRLSEISKQDIARKLEKLNRTPSQKSHSLVVCKILFRWALAHGYVDVDPTAAFKAPRQRKRGRVLKEDELRKVWGAALEQGYPHGTIVQLLILTGQRRGEIAGLHRSWIEAKERTITLPASITKNGNEHTFPYGDMAAAILDGLSIAQGLLFPSRWSPHRPLSGFSKFKQEMTDGVDGWTLHDLRRTYRTIHARIGTAPHIAERLINHVAAVASNIEQTYDVYTYLPEMRAAAIAFEAYLAKLIQTPEITVERAA